jgi:hypothetical protein
MAIARRFKITHDEVFPFGAYLISEVGPVFDFERSTKDNKVQQVDKDTGLLLWSVDVLDADPDAGRKSRTVSVKIAAKVQPVPPPPDPASPFRLVVFEGLSALPYIEESGNFSRIAWSFKADGLTAPTRAPRAMPASAQASTPGDGKAA